MKSVHKMTSDEKLKSWGYGEWVEEPDFVTFTHNGLDCACIRMPHTGIWCGYVKIPDNYVLYEKDYGHEAYESIDVHGGLTFSGSRSNFDLDGFWVGFDCGHSCDVSPYSEVVMLMTDETMKKLFPTDDHSLFTRTYKNLNYVMEECKSLADQIANYNKATNAQQS